MPGCVQARCEQPPWKHIFHSQFKSFLGPSDLSSLGSGWLISTAHCCPCPLTEPLPPYLPHHQWASLADKPPRSLWWPYWLYVLSNLFGSIAKGESCTPLPQQQRYTHSSGFSLKKSISSPPKGLQHLICSNPLRIETQNWSDFLGIPSWIDTELLVIFLYMCPPTDYNSFVQPSGNLAHTHQTLLFSPSCFTHVTKTGPQSNIYWPFIIY